MTRTAGPLLADWRNLPRLHPVNLRLRRLLVPSPGRFHQRLGDVDTLGGDDAGVHQDRLGKVLVEEAGELVWAGPGKKRDPN